ncbi:amphi-Trp domain-containing protein [Paraglaciecola aquimarina]|uniref:Amphi-Trp domain-containing protein n=1 Tax=Paraglaciecola aquimarina TaxID=1235557 RepID=A0ABU3T0V2_9ALTE|nr:amphi-Trp domain-containing protein [Paraglaciecola aquimarina]MDU0355847.1 amphi-Trp domain-containing protein [Paraglaciecola aquimarina]
MLQSKNTFRHESLQDNKSIQDILKAITKGIGKGKLVFSDDNDSFEIHPEGLLQLKVTASEDESRHRLDLRISWQPKERVLEEKNLKVE